MGEHRGTLGWSESLTWLAGVDSCKAGWCAAFRDTESGQVSCAVFERFADILGVGEEPGVLAVDMPIGLVEKGERTCDLEIRRLAKGRAASVFPAPIRPVLNIEHYVDANALTKRISGKGMSRQSFGILRKIRELDGVVRGMKEGRVYEAFPEMAYVRMNSYEPLKASKHRAGGLLERRKLLTKAYGSVESIERSAKGLKGVALHDVYDALAVLETAQHIINGEAQRVPEDSWRDTVGLTMQILF